MNESPCISITQTINFVNLLGIEFKNLLKFSDGLAGAMFGAVAATDAL